MLKANRAGLLEGPPQRSAQGPAGTQGGFLLLQERGNFHPAQISSFSSTKAALLADQ